MGEIPLLRASGGEAGKTREIVSRTLETREWLGGGIVVEKVVGGKLLRAIDFVVEASGELIDVFGAAGNRGESAGAEGRDVFVIDRESGRVEAFDRDLRIREYRSVRRARSDCRAAFGGDGLLARLAAASGGAIGKLGGECLIVDGIGKAAWISAAASAGKIARRFGRAGELHGPG